MKIFVTGAGGQVGPDLVAALRARGDEVIASDQTLPAAAGNGWQRLDVTDDAAVRDAIERARPEIVFHLAAVLSARGERDPEKTHAVNHTGTHNVLEACRRAGVRQMLFTSSIAVFGPNAPEPAPDDAALQPTTIYGVTKVTGELLGDYYHRRYGLDFRAVRFPGLIGASLPGGGTSDYALYMYVDGVRRGHYESFCRADTRIPFMYLPDAIRALVELSAAPRERLRRSVYNVAAFSPTAAEIAASVCRALPDTQITFTPDPPRQAILDSWPRVLDDRTARADWDWSPAFDLEQMTADLVPRLRSLVAERADALAADPDHR